MAEITRPFPALTASLWGAPERYAWHEMRAEAGGGGYRQLITTVVDRRPHSINWIRVTDEVAADAHASFGRDRWGGPRIARCRLSG